MILSLMTAHDLRQLLNSTKPCATMTKVYQTAHRKEILDATVRLGQLIAGYDALRAVAHNPTARRIALEEINELRARIDRLGEEFDA